MSDQNTSFRSEDTEPVDGEHDESIAESRSNLNQTNRSDRVSASQTQRSNQGYDRNIALANGSSLEGEEEPPARQNPGIFPRSSSSNSQGNASSGNDRNGLDFTAEQDQFFDHQTQPTAHARSHLADLQPPTGDLEDDKISVNSHMDFPEYANEHNKELHRQILEKRRELRQVTELTEDVGERHKVMAEHLANIKLEIQHAQSINEVKQKEIDAETHFGLITQRQLGKLQSELKSADAKVTDMREKLNDAQKRVFENNQKIEKARLEINWNREEMDQWLAAARQKEEDRLALERFQRADESKIKEINLNIEKLTATNTRLEGELAREVTETQALQIQINRMAEEFRKETEDHHRLALQWETLYRAIENKDRLVLSSSGKMESYKSTNSEKDRQIEELRGSAKALVAENAFRQENIQKFERAIYHNKNEAKTLKESERDIKAEMRILQNRISAFSSELERKRSLLTTLGNDLTVKQKRLSIVENRFHRQMQIFQSNQSTEKELERMVMGCEVELKHAEKELADYLKHLGNRKHEFYQAQKDLFKCKQSQSALLAETSGLTTKIKNLAAHSVKLFAEIQKQQELLYNAEYQIQLLERKVARAQGEKTIEETDYLIEKIRQAKEEHSKVNQKYQATVTAMKNLSDEHRTLEKRIKALEEEEKKLVVLIDKINLENDMTLADLSNIVGRKEEVLVQNNVMKLELQKIQGRVLGGHNDVLGLQNTKTELETAMAQREREITLHQAVLAAECKLAEQERHKAAIELAERRNKVKNMQIKYQSLIQSKQGSVDIFEHSQAYYIIKAAQEKEELQRREEEIKAQVSKAEFELKALENTRNHLQGRNSKLREYQLNKNATQADFELKRSLQEQFHAAGNNLVERKRELDVLKAACENGQHFLAENSKKLDLLKARKKEMTSAALNAKGEQNEQAAKLERAVKAVQKNLALLAKKKLKFDEETLEFWQWRLLVLESLTKTVNSLIKWGYKFY